MPTEQEIAAVVATKGRTKELSRLLESLRKQSRPLDEILIADQNTDDRLIQILEPFGDLPIRHLRMPELQGANRNRNFGWRQCEADLILFPDDDCWYPVDFLEKATGLLRESGADVVCGRPATVEGRTINGRFLMRPVQVDRQTVWFTQIEWTFVTRRAVLEAIGGLDEELGVGAQTPWGAGEMQDFSLRALAMGFTEIYDPLLIAHHDEVIPSKSDAVSWHNRIASYARGMGYVLAKHDYSFFTALTWTVRPLIGAILMLMRFEFWLAGLKVTTALNRMKGYLAYKRREARPGEC